MEASRLFDTSVESVVRDLVSGREVPIKGFGSFRFRKRIGMSTVFFVSETIENRTREDSNPKGDDISFVFQLLRQVLSEGETLSIDSLGTFREVAGRISFIPSPVLRNKLNKVEDDLQAAAETSHVAAKTLRTTVEEITPEVIEGEDATGANRELNAATEEEAVAMITTPADGHQQEEEHQQDEEVEIPRPHPPVSTKKKRRFRMIILALGISLVAILLLIYTKEEADPLLKETVREENPSGFVHQETIASSNADNLLELSQLHYGNQVFWVYLFDANKSILHSPLQSLKGLAVEIPDLREMYGVDFRDTLEIKRAEESGKLLLKMIRMNNK